MCCYMWICIKFYEIRRTGIKYVPATRKELKLWTFCLGLRSAGASRGGLVTDTDRQTDRHTDGHRVIAYTALA